MGFKRFVNMMEILVAVVTLGFVVMLFANEPGDGTTGGGGGRGGSGDAAPSASVFAASCAGCHGADGGGGVGPELAGKVADAFPDVADEIAIVTNGRRGMPAFGGRLTAQEIEQVVEYTRTGLGG